MRKRRGSDADASGGDEAWRSLHTVSALARSLHVDDAAQARAAVQLLEGLRWRKGGRREGREGERKGGMRGRERQRHHPLEVRCKAHRDCTEG
eukprot:451183-Rhodomonas_salina.3